MLNKVQLIGNLGQDPEMRETASGQAVGNFSVATSEKVGKGEDREEKTEWHRVIVWGKTAEVCGQYLTKGSKVYVEGRLQTRDWEDKEGNPKRTTEVVAYKVLFLSGKGEGGGGSKRETPPAPNDDDFPF